jgi:RNA recognition motif-containing protein
MTDPLSGLSRGYGFVRFLNKNEQQDAVIEMNGIICNNRPMRVSFATPKNNHNTTRYLQLALQAPALIQKPTDPNNTTVFVGGLSSPVSEEELGHYFSPFGEVSYVKIPPGKGCGFVQYVTRQSAEQAIERMNGFVIGSSRIRLSWGRSQADKSPSHGGLFDGNDSNMMMISPTTTTTTLSTNNTANLFSSFRPLSPPHQQQQFYTTAPNHLAQEHQQDMLISHNNNNNVLFRSEDDWLNGSTGATASNTANMNHYHHMDYDTAGADGAQEGWHMNGISYA